MQIEMLIDDVEREMQRAVAEGGQAEIAADADQLRPASDDA